MIAARCAVSRSGIAVVQRRSASTVPRLGSEEFMKSDMLSQVRARLAYQKELKSKAGDHSHEEHVAEMLKWVKISFVVAIPLCIVSCTKDVLFGHHDHGHEGLNPEYMKIRTKQFPWECEDCELFNGKCWEACRAEKASAGN